MALQHLRSSTANKRPTPAGMSDGQLALNTNDASPGLFFKDSNGALVKVGPVHVGTTAPNATPGAGGSSGNSVGEQWLDTTGGTYVFKVWDGSAWRSETGTFVDVNGDTMTGALGIIAGSASTPGLFFSGDTNTGIYSPGADQLALSTNGTGRLFVDASGNVGVGGSPTAKLHVLSGTSSASVSTNADDLFVENNGNVGITIGSPNTALASIRFTDPESNGAGILLYNHSDNSLAFTVNDSERLRITSAGLVGVGTSTPVSGAQLTVAGSALAVTGQNLDHSANSIRIGQEGSGAAQIRCYGPNTSTNGSLTFKMSRSDGTNSQDVVIDGSGRLGIGATPSAKLHVNTGTNENLWVGSLGGSGAGVYLASVNDSASANTPMQIGSASVINFAINGAEAARIDSSRRLLVGTSSARGNFFNTTVSALSQVEEVGGATANYSAVTNVAGATGPTFVFGKTRGTSTGANTVVVADDGIGALSFQGSDGSEFVEAATIRAFVDGTPGTNDMPGRLVFSTTADGASSPSEVMRIRNSGQVWTISISSSFYTATTQAAGTTYSLFSGSYGASSIGGGTESFRVWSNGNVQNTNNSYTAISDIKLKENIADAGSQWADLKALRVRNYNLKEGQTHRQIGLIAQEVEPISPGLVYESPDRDAEGNDLGTVTKSVNYSVLYMKAVKALQEAMERIEQLETANADLLARVAALESA